MATFHSSSTGLVFVWAAVQRHLPDSPHDRLSPVTSHAQSCHDQPSTESADQHPSFDFADSRCLLSFACVISIRSRLLATAARRFSYRLHSATPKRHDLPLPIHHCHVSPCATSAPCRNSSPGPFWVLLLRSLPARRGVMGGLR